MAPTIEAVCLALADITLILKHPWELGKAYNPPKLNLFLQTRLEWMKAFLWVFVDKTNDLVMGANGAQWTAASLCKHCPERPFIARWLCQWAKAYITDHTCLPVNVFGTWNNLGLMMRILHKRLHSICKGLVNGSRPWILFTTWTDLQ